ncbi:MAG TPA: hypothetical protein DCX27_21590 [Balneola sp.]|jgi:hypothetical protein|nr:hypothetical protein [Balneola sp.]|tara:strand:+ start:1305 stop:1619 length:315 start_codon:yes stop_codon:yes gene_type:complete
MKIRDFNFRGDFRLNHPSGNSISYEKGDVVYHESKAYIASKRISGSSPTLGERVGWMSLSDRSVLYESNTVPFYAKIGDEWFNTSNGILYKRIESNSVQIWVEL